MITECVAARQATKTKYGRPPANRTINLELSILKRMLRLTYEHGKLFRVPVIRLLKDVYLHGDSFVGHPQDLAVMAAWGLAGLAVAWRFFGWEPREQ